MRRGGGVVGEVGKLAAALRVRVGGGLAGGARGVGAVRAELGASLEAHGVAYDVEAGDHVRRTRSAADALVAMGHAKGSTLTIACGGGEVVDCGKAVAHELGVPLMAVPTVASTNAAGTTGYRLGGTLQGGGGRTARRRSWRTRRSSRERGHPF